MTNRIPRKGYKCRNDSIWVDTLSRLNEGGVVHRSIQKEGKCLPSSREIGLCCCWQAVGRNGNSHVLSKEQAEDAMTRLLLFILPRGEYAS